LFVREWGDKTPKKSRTIPKNVLASPSTGQTDMITYNEAIDLFIDTVIPDGRRGRPPNNLLRIHKVALRKWKQGKEDWYTEARKQAHSSRAFTTSGRGPGGAKSLLNRNSQTSTLINIIYQKWISAGCPVDVHIYQQLRRTNTALLNRIENLEARLAEYELDSEDGEDNEEDDNESDFSETDEHPEFPVKKEDKEDDEDKQPPLISVQ
jgi:hypothetical protein